MMRKHLRKTVFCLALLVLASASAGCADEGGSGAGSKGMPVADLQESEVPGASSGAFRCYTLNNCRGPYHNNVADIRACISLDGNSWRDASGGCRSDINPN